MGIKDKHPTKPVTLAIIGCGQRGNVRRVRILAAYVLINFITRPTQNTL
jgi:hypothetical protein